MDITALKQNARAALANKWNIFALGTLIYTCINSAFQISSLLSDLNGFLAALEYETAIEIPDFLYSIGSIAAYSPLSMFSGIFNIAILPVLAFGLCSMGYKTIHSAEIKPLNIFDGFRNFGSVLILNLLSTLYVMLWSLLFFIPGIIKSISYSMAQFILAENPDIKPSQALKESEKLMYGYKWDYFVLGLSFIGWQIIALLTFGIASIWIIPYIQTTNAAFYERIKVEKYGDAAAYVYKGAAYQPQFENGYAPYQQGGAPYTPNTNGYNPYQQNTAPQAPNANGYNPYQQNGTTYAPDASGYEPRDNTYYGYPYSPQGFVSDEYGNPIQTPPQQTTPENNAYVNPPAPEQTDNGFNQ